MKNALITGSSTGIGKQIGLDLLKLGYHVIFNGRDVDNLQKLGLELHSLNLNRFSLWTADLSNINEINLVPFPKLDAIILNAGMTDRTPFGEVLEHNWNKVFDTNLTVPFFLIQKLKNNINKNGRIIFISSILAEVAHSTSISYSVSKAGINILVKNLAKEFSAKGITVNAISPGFIGDTDWHKNKSKAQIKRIEKKILLNRLGKTKEVSSLVMEVMRNQYINGTTLHVDGGYNLK